MTRRISLACATVMTSLAVMAPGAHAQLADMGHRAIAADAPRPLLTIMGEFKDRRFNAAPTRHSAGGYARLLFGDELGFCCGSVAGRSGFFEENSHGRFVFRPAAIPSSVPAAHRGAGILGPYTHPDDWRTRKDESVRRWAGTSKTASCPGGTKVEEQDFSIRCNIIRRAIDDGFPIRSYDRDGDSCITNDELTIMIVWADALTPDEGGQTAFVGPLRLPGLPLKWLCPWVANLGESAPASTFAHELTHTLGAEHSYGDSCRNDGYTVMSCPLGGADARGIVHIDPFIKMKLGWITPQLIRTSAPTSCVTLRAAGLPLVPGVPQAYAVYDPSRGTDEFFRVSGRLVGEPRAAIIA